MVILTYFVRGSIPERLTSCLIGLDLNKQVNLFSFNISKAAETYQIKPGAYPIKIFSVNFMLR